MTSHACMTGAKALLRDCMGAVAGDSLLIVREPPGAGYYDDAAPGIADSAARDLGLRACLVEAPPGVEDLSALGAFAATLGGFDHVLFLARVGDQLRFSAIPGVASAAMCYALDREAFGSPFAVAPHAALCALKQAIDEAMSRATLIRVTCPLGSDYSGRAPQCGEAPADTSVRRFPMLVPRPLPSAGFRGRVVLSRFLVGTGSRFYAPYALALDADVTAIVEGNRLTRLDGPEPQVARIRAHYADIAGRYGLDPWFVHSWHAGIHPACAFRGEALAAMERWSGSAFGNPRILHFHTCGDYAPGEISWTILDPTVTLDGLALWENGRLRPERLPEGATILDANPILAALFANPERAVGLGN